MDWDYLLSVSIEDLTEEEKDELYNTITWFNTETEDINLEKSNTLLKISQEVLKYKGEQVEILLHKLDELAIQQAEDEVKKSDTDAKSSRKSSSIEFENLEQKYFELRNKLKKQVRINEKNLTEINKFMKEIEILKQEKNQLLNEIQLTQDDNHSDVSESVKDQHNELMKTLHNKNKQISDLLHDIEMTENENIILRDKLSAIRDELEDATKEINSLTELQKVQKNELDSYSENIKKLTAENEILHEELDDLTEQKKDLEKEIAVFTEEVNIRVDEWKKILEEKEKTINELKSSQVQTLSHHSSNSSLLQDKEKSYISTLNKIINQRETQLLDLKTQLQECTKEMEESTNTIQKLTKDKESGLKIISDLNESVKELKKQLKNTHQRCQNFQNELEHAEKAVVNKDEDIKEILEKIKNEGKTDMADVLTEIQGLKNQIRAQEKKIIQLVKATNTLQESCDQYERENEILRDKLGINSEETIDLSAMSVKQKVQKKQSQELKKKLQKQEDDLLRLRMENLQLSRSKSQHKDDYDSNDTKTQLKRLVEENEALRKGLHEILDSFNTKKGQMELNSETLEHLLRALDVKHVSGWYHPAMRLQAELHNLEGVNAELREQLRSVRSNEQKSEDATVKYDQSIDTKSLQEHLQTLFTKLELESSKSDKIEKKMISYKENYHAIEHQMELLYEEYAKEKQSYIDKMSEIEERMIDLEDSNAIKDEKIKILSENHPSEESVIARCLELVENNVVLIRKRSYLENDLEKLREQINKLQNNFIKSKDEFMEKMNDAIKENVNLIAENEVLKRESENFVHLNVHQQLNKQFDDLLLKYRNLLQEFQTIEQNKANDFKMLETICTNLTEERDEFKQKIVELKQKNFCESIDSDNNEILKKLAETEIREVSERQRANHTDNLFILVKEQLQTAEDRLKQTENNCNDLIRKNLLLQEQLKDTEDKLCNFIHAEKYDLVKTENCEMIKEIGELKLELVELQKKLGDNDSLVMFWNCEKERELLSLKHEIVDLQSESDHKMQIARLNSELARLKSVEGVLQREIEEVKSEYEACKMRNGKLSQEIEKKSSGFVQKEAEFKTKLGILRDILSKFRLQYLFCVPLQTEEKIINNIKQATSDKHDAFLAFYNSRITESEAATLKEQNETEFNNLKNALKSNLTDFRNVEELLNGLIDKKSLICNEIKYRRQCELKDTQLKHVFNRVKTQDEQIMKLEEELFDLYKNISVEVESDCLERKRVEIERRVETPVVRLVSVETQTVNDGHSCENEIEEGVEEEESMKQNDSSISSENTATDFSNQIEAKDQIIQQLKSKLNECEMNISLFRKQLGDKQSQITFYERHILELQSSKESVTQNLETNETITSLKASLKIIQDKLKVKEDEILKYQALLKEDRDKHSMAAALMREELTVLENTLANEKEKYLKLKSTQRDSHPSKMALEQYFVQVHALEDELCNLRTRVSGLELQLQASRQEAVRWRTLANERLESMQKLGTELENVHDNEIMVYKAESEKWREEVSNLKQLIGKYRSEMCHDFDIQRVFKEKEDKIHELTVKLRLAKSETKRSFIDKSESESATKLNELELTKEQLIKEHETLRKRFDLLLTREKNAKEEIRELKGKLIKKPILSARSDKSDKSIKEQLQKKINLLEDEIIQLKTNLANQISINESHRKKIEEDFDKWNKQKHWQQTAEKLKSKLKTKESDFEKLQQTCSGYRILIERLEREKFNLEHKLKHLKTANNVNEIESLRAENMKLVAENESLCSKLEMQQHHSGGLGAAMLQEKLEAQERKIAVLELSAKAPVDVRAELERLQNSVSNLQKKNLCLEAENLEMRLDLEKANKEMPHLRQQISHLETYIEVLKKENDTPDPDCTNQVNNSKKIPDLERTVFVLKRVVEKLQVENKRLLSGKRPCSERLGASDKLRRDYQRLKEQYCESIQRVALLEKEISEFKSENKPHDSVQTSALTKELEIVREQLDQKTLLLSKVKVLLQRAAVKETELIQEITDLRKSNENQFEGI